MYGIIHIAIKKHVINTYGENTWKNIKSRYGEDIDIDLTNRPYDEKEVYSLASILSEEENVTASLGDILYTFGKIIMIEARENYNDIMQSRGNTFKEYLVTLPAFHNRMMLISPNLSPPEFKLSNIEDRSMCVHYMCKEREICKDKNFHNFIEGFICGLAYVFNEVATVEWTKFMDTDRPQDVFKVTW